jgi:hypothetical protein
MVILDVMNKCINGNEENRELFGLLYREIILLENLRTEFSLPYFLLQLAVNCGCSPDFDTFKKGHIMNTESGLFIEDHQASADLQNCAEFIHQLWLYKGRNYSDFNDKIRAMSSNILIEHLSCHLNQSLTTDTLDLLRGIMR